MLLSFLLICIGIYSKPLSYTTIKNIKNIYYNNLLTYDIYSNETITNNNLLTAEHIFPQSYTKKYKDAKRDMHNIFLTNAETNIYRSNYPFRDENNCFHLQEYKYFIPCDFAKGQIARSIAYMKLIYPLLDVGKVIDIELLLYWNKQFEPHFLEHNRNILINNIQGNYNPFICDPNLIYKFFHIFN
tara:strand:- start:485 stop:1042 length:558 start_codon:yes stop_codon:yes gene_type:complete